MMPTSLISRHAATPLLSLLGLLLCLLTGIVRADDPAPAAAPAPVQIRMEKDTWRVTVLGDPVIDAHIAQDGALVGLRFIRPDELYGGNVPNPHRPSFVKTGTGLPDELALGGSRGLFFLDEEPLILGKPQPHGDTGLLADSDRASLLYDFQPGHIGLTATNKTDHPICLLMVIDPTVCVVAAPGKSPVPAPAVKLWADTTWYQDGMVAWWTVNLTGGNRIWGPGTVVGKAWREGMFQVWEATLAAGESRQITMAVARATEAEVSLAKEIVPEPPPGRRTPPMVFTVPKLAVEGEVTLYSPVDYRVFQRQNDHRGRVLVSGKVATACETVSVHFDDVLSSPYAPKGGGALSVGPDIYYDEHVPVDPVTRSFSAEFDIPAGGWYTLEVKSPAGTARVEHVGVGEVFVVCGQSNSTNYGTGSTPPNRTATGRVSTFGGDYWALAEDPLPGTTDASQGGSPWTFFGDAMVKRYDVPVAIAITGQGGAPVQHWTPGKFPFFWVMMRVSQLGPGGFRAMLWHQGESNTGGTTEHYYQTLSTIIRASHTLAGWDFPWMVAQVSYHNPKEASFDSTRKAQKQLWDEGLALEGPDTDTIVGEDRAGIHLSPSGLKKHGEMWATKVSAYLDRTFESTPAAEPTK